jgi:hypothetical protein
MYFIKEIYSRIYNNPEILDSVDDPTEFGFLVGAFFIIGGIVILILTDLYVNKKGAKN